MNKNFFTLRPTEDFIELMKLLKVMQLAQTGGHAKIMIEEGSVLVNGEQEARKRRKLRDGDVVAVEEQEVVIKAA